MQEDDQLDPPSHAEKRRAERVRLALIMSADRAAGVPVRTTAARLGVAQTTLYRAYKENGGDIDPNNRTRNSTHAHARLVKPRKIPPPTTAQAVARLQAARSAKANGKFQKGYNSVGGDKQNDSPKYTGDHNQTPIQLIDYDAVMDESIQFERNLHSHQDNHVSGTTEDLNALIDNIALVNTNKLKAAKSQMDANIAKLRKELADGDNGPNDSIQINNPGKLTVGNQESGLNMGTYEDLQLMAAPRIRVVLKEVEDEVAEARKIVKQRPNNRLN